MKIDLFWSFPLYFSTMEPACANSQLIWQVAGHLMISLYNSHLVPRVTIIGPNTKSLVTL